MDKRTLIQEMASLSEQAERLSNIDKEIQELSGKKATLEKDIKILQVSLVDMKDKHDKAIKGFDEEIKFKQNLISELQHKQSQISSINSSEISRLEKLKGDIQSAQSGLISDKNNHEKNIALFNIDKKSFADKLVIVDKIKELATNL